MQQQMHNLEVLYWQTEFDQIEVGRKGHLYTIKNSHYFADHANLISAIFHQILNFIKYCWYGTRPGKDTFSYVAKAAANPTTLQALFLKTVVPDIDRIVGFVNVTNNNTLANNKDREWVRFVEFLQGLESKGYLQWNAPNKPIMLSTENGKETTVYYLSLLNRYVFAPSYDFHNYWNPDISS